MIRSYSCCEGNCICVMISVAITASLKGFKQTGGPSKFLSTSFIFFPFHMHVPLYHRHRQVNSLDLPLSCLLAPHAPTLWCNTTSSSSRDILPHSGSVILTYLFTTVKMLSTNSKVTAIFMRGKKRVSFLDHL